MSTTSDGTLQDQLTSQGIPTEGLSEECLRMTLEGLGGDDVNSLLTHLNDLYSHSPSIRPLILPFLCSLFISHSTNPFIHALLPAHPFFTTLYHSLLLDPSERVLEWGLKLLVITLPGGVVGAGWADKGKVGELMVILGRGVVWSNLLDEYENSGSGSGHTKGHRPGHHRNRSSDLNLISPNSLHDAHGNYLPHHLHNQHHPPDSTGLGTGLDNRRESNISTTSTDYSSTSNLSTSPTNTRGIPEGTGESENPLTGSISPSPPNLHDHHPRPPFSPSSLSFPSSANKFSPQHLERQRGQRSLPKPLASVGWRVFNDPLGSGIGSGGGGGNASASRIGSGSGAGTGGAGSGAGAGGGHSRTTSASASIAASVNAYNAVHQRRRSLAPTGIGMGLGLGLSGFTAASGEGAQREVETSGHDKDKEREKEKDKPVLSRNTSLTHPHPHSHPHPTSRRPSATLTLTDKPLYEYLLLLYAIFPVNLMRFMQEPGRYLMESGVEGVWALEGKEREGWEGFWAEGEFVERVGPHLQKLKFNPGVLLASSPSTEIDNLPYRFGKSEVAAIMALVASLRPEPPNQGGRRQSAEEGLGLKQHLSSQAHQGHVHFGPGIGGGAHSHTATASGTTTRKSSGDTFTMIEHQNRQGSTSEPIGIASASGTNRPTLSRALSGETHTSNETVSTISVSPYSRRSPEMTGFSHNHNHGQSHHGHGGMPNPIAAISRTAPSGVYAFAVTSQTQPIAIRGGGVGIGGDGGAEVERLRREVGRLELELRHARKLAETYLQHVQRLHKASTAVQSDEAERQNMYNLLKEQSKTLATRDAELAQVRNDLYRTKQMNTKWNEETREKANSFRTEKRRILQEQGKVNDELQDKDRIIEHQQIELAKEKEKSFKLDNRLKEAEPKIRKIEDYETEINKMMENQKLWDSDLVKLNDHKQALDRMTSAFTQMSGLISALEGEKKTLATTVQSQRSEIAELHADLQATGKGDKATQSDEGGFKGFERELFGLRDTLRNHRKQIDRLEEERLNAAADREELEFLRQGQTQGKGTLL